MVYNKITNSESQAVFTRRQSSKQTKSMYENPHALLSRCPIHIAPWHQYTAIHCRLGHERIKQRF